MTHREFIRETAIASVTIMTCYALYLGHDGVMLAGVVAVISGIAGYKIHDKFDFGKWIG